MLHSGVYYTIYSFFSAVSYPFILIFFLQYLSISIRRRLKSHAFVPQSGIDKLLK